MNLTTERLELNELRTEDLPEIHKLISIPEVDEFNTLGIPRDLDHTTEIFKYVLEDQKKPIRKHFLWTIRRKDTGELIGEFGFNLGKEHYKRGEIFYNLNPKQWGNGFGTEAAKRVLDFGFDSLNLHRIEAGVATQNTKSVRLLEKIGMTREGKHREILPIRGNFVDNYSYAILDKDREL